MLGRRSFLGGLLAAPFSGCRTGCRAKRVQTGVFSVYIAWAAKNQGTDEAVVARRMIANGVTGIDAEFREDERLRRLKGEGMELASMYGMIHFLEPAKGAREADAFLASAASHRAPRLMVIPDNFPPDCDREKALDGIIAGLADFTARAKKEGFQVTIEDFGAASSPCSQIAPMQRMFDSIPDLGFTIDTGNYFHAGHGDDILDAFSLFRARIRHAHLKDRPAAAPQGYAPLGQGALPNERIVRELVAEGYDGWFTLEEHGAKDIAAATYAAAAVLRGWLA